MITTVLIEVEDGVPPPTSNGFPVCAHEVVGHSPWRVDTGLTLKIPKGYSLRFDSVDDFFVTGSMFKEGRLWVMVDSFHQGLESWAPKLPSEQRVAIAWIDKCEAVSLRFMEMSSSGGRIIRGDAQVVDSSANRDAES